MKIKLLLALLLASISGFTQGTITPVASFGSNPGNLNMYTYVPTGISGSAPLVMVLHGCTQTAQQASDQTGWNKLANTYKFYVVYPEQKSTNNSSSCFNWFETADQEKDQGEDLSLRQMIDYMKSNYNIDTTKIFATGLSAGAAMTSVLCATYPEIFNAGAIMSGGPYKAATNATEAYYAMQGTVTNTPSNWANLVFAENPGYTGSYPRIAIFHGTSDPVVNINNATELMKQWTAVHSIPQTASQTFNSYGGNSLINYNLYKGGLPQKEVRSYIINSFGHAIALDTGSCPQQGGQTATYAYDINFHSTWEAAHFFGLIDTTSETLIISGPAGALAGSTLPFTASPSNEAYYLWDAPPNSNVTSGQGTSSIQMYLGSPGGLLTVSALDNNGCYYGPEQVYVGICTCTGIEENLKTDYSIYYNSDTHSIYINRDENYTFTLYSIIGEEVIKSEANGNTIITIPSTISNGTYLIKLEGNKGRVFKKIVIY